MRPTIIPCALVVMIAFLGARDGSGQDFRTEYATVSTPETLAQVFIFRKDQFAASASDIALSVDGSIVSWLDGGEYLRVPLSPGRHLIAATLVRKGEDTFSWYAEYWPRQATEPPSDTSMDSVFNNALLSLPPDTALGDPTIAEAYRLAVTEAVGRATVARTTHHGVLTAGKNKWVWAEARSLEDLEATLDQIFESLGKDREQFEPRIPPSRFKRARRVVAVTVDARAGENLFLYLGFGHFQPWRQSSEDESLEKFGAFTPAANEKYGVEWRVGEKFLKNRD